METIDRAAEWRRLKDVYAQMSDDELAVVAGECYQLTDLAKQALEAETGRRGLGLKLASTPPEPEDSGNRNVSADDNGEDDEQDGDFGPESLDLVPLCRVWDVVEARSVKGVLDGAGIPSFLGDDNLENVDNYKGSFEGGLDLKVRGVDQSWASRTLANNRPKPLEQDSAGSESDQAEYAIKCPKCRSTEVVFEGRDGEQTGNAAFNAKYKWSCDSCGHEWEDDGIEQQV
jgi:DNA-directed RNA polymerase subunit M/transcription elongation factor TFIIS